MLYMIYVIIDITWASVIAITTQFPCGLVDKELIWQVQGIWFNPN